MKLNTQKIAEIMADRGINQSDLARELGCTRQWISLILDEGRYGSTLKTVQKIGEALDVDPITLLH